MTEIDAPIYCIAALIDLLGFASHLEVGGNDLRTNIGKEAVTRLQTLRHAITLMAREMDVAHDAYGHDFKSALHFTRINDALILTVDLPSILTPGIGEAVRSGFSVPELEKLIGGEITGLGEDEFKRRYADAVGKSVVPVLKFVGLIARIHWFVNRVESAKTFPGAKTVVATGYRRAIGDDADHSFLDANFAFSNAYAAEKHLHGAKMFLDDNTMRLIAAHRFGANVLKYASVVETNRPFDTYAKRDDPMWTPSDRALSVAKEIELFRRRVYFREADPRALAFLHGLPSIEQQLLVPETSPVTGAWRAILNRLVTGPVEHRPNDRGLLQAVGDLTDDIRIFGEYITQGDSPTEHSRFQAGIQSNTLRALFPFVQVDSEE